MKLWVYLSVFWRMRAPRIAPHIWYNQNYFRVLVGRTCKASYNHDTCQILLVGVAKRKWRVRMADSSPEVLVLAFLFGSTSSSDLLSNIILMTLEKLGIAEGIIYIVVVSRWGLLLMQAICHGSSKPVSAITYEVLPLQLFGAKWSLNACIVSRTSIISPSTLNESIDIPCKALGAKTFRLPTCTMIGWWKAGQTSN